MSAARRTDYYVRHLGEDDIERVAHEWRARAIEYFRYDYFDVVEFIRKVLRGQLRKKDKLRIRFLPTDSPGPPARVSFRPLTLWVRVDIWSGARDNHDALSRYILAHECGHLILHDHDAKGFSGENGERIPQSDQERSAEWQADRFADHFLAPIEVVERLSTGGVAVERCGVPLEVALRRLGSVAQHWERWSKPCGMDCSRCYGCDTHRISNRIRCRTCGQVETVLL